MIVKRAIEQFKHVWKEPEKRRFLVMRTAGNFLVLLALFAVVATFGPVIVSEGKYRYQKLAGIRYEVVGSEIVRRYEASDSSPLARLLSGDRPRIERIAPASTEFGIVIPKIGANERVIANVNAGSEKEYQRALLSGVAHAEGTGFPGGNRKVYLFAHSTDNWWNVNRYNAVFFLLKELTAGDEIDLFYNGHRHIYRAVETKVVEANEVHYLVEPSEEEVLVLQTCWPPGTTLKRLLVIAKPVSALSRN